MTAFLKKIRPLYYWLAGLAVVHFPVGVSNRDTQTQFARAPHVVMAPLSSAIRDRLGNGRIVSN